MKIKKMNKKKVILLTAISVLLTAVLTLSGVGIYLHFNKKENPAKVNPLDFSIDKWDGKTVDGLNFNENYASRGLKTKTINSVSSFIHFIQEVNSGNSFEDYTVYLNVSIDLEGNLIDTIGTAEHPFKGTFDGGFYTIYNANINGDGLFNRTENATIKNIGLYNANTNLINTAVNTNIENVFVRLGTGLIANEFISNNGKNTIKNSFVDSNAEGLINKLDTNNSSENTVEISNCYFTNGEASIKEKVGETFTFEEKVIKAKNKSDFAEWSYSKEYSNEFEWCDYDYLENSRELNFVLPVQRGFVKVYLTGSCFESVMVAGDSVVETTNLSAAFVEADKEAEAEVNLLVEKIFMEAQAEVSNSNVTVNAVKDTTIIRGNNNTTNMFVATGNSKIELGSSSEVSTSSASSSNQSTITLDGNRDYIEKNNLKSGAMVVAYGGEVEIHNNVVIKDNINNSDVSYGGAVLLYNTKTKANLKATFENCQAEYGGAVCVIGTTINNLGSFYNCTAEKAGGAIYLDMQLPTEETEAVRSLYGKGLQIKPMDTIVDQQQTVDAGTDFDASYNNVVFEGCSAETYGGAIYCSGALTMSGSPTFTDNSAAKKGGAIYCKNFNISGSPTFNKNKAYSTVSDSVEGGAVECSNLTISGNPQFYENSVDNLVKDGSGDNGGAISCNSFVISGNPIFENNSSCQYGGAINFAAASRIEVGSEAIFKSNSAIGGGCLHAVTAKLEIAGNPTFELNMATSEDEGDWNITKGGAIDGTVTISGNPIFKSNSAYYFGGAICGTVEISGNPIFKSNSVTKTKSGQGSGGGAIRGNVTISGHATFESNSSSKCGGAIYGTVTISGSAHFISNTATTEGGAIQNGFNKLIISGEAVFESNSANYGGAIHFWGDEIEISGYAEFNKNSAEVYGGAIQHRKLLTISGTANFNENTAKSDGGAIYHDSNSTLIISGKANFVSNRSSNDGGAIASNKSSVEISGEASFSANTASAWGGAICAKKTSSVLISGDVDFNDNIAYAGCAIYAGDSGTLTISGTVELNNNYNPTKTTEQYELIATNLTLGKGLIVKSNVHTNFAQIRIFQNYHIKVTEQIDQKIYVLKANAAVYNSDNTESFIFEDATETGLTGVSGSFPFHVINAPAGSAIDYNNLKSKFGVLTSGVPETIIQMPKYVETNEKEETSTITVKAPVAGTYSVVSSDESVVKVLSVELQDSVSTASMSTQSTTSLEVPANRSVSITTEVVGSGEADLNVTFTPTNTTANAITNEVIKYNVLDVYTTTIVVNDSANGSVNVSSLQAISGSSIVINEDGSLIIGDNDPIIATPTSNTAQYKYEFVGWSGVVDTLTHDMMIMANFTKSLNKYTLKFEADSTLGSLDKLIVENVAYGTIVRFKENVITLGEDLNQITITATPKDKTNQYTYSFVEWEGVIDVVEASVTIKAIFKSELSKHIITIVSTPDGYGTVSKTSVAEVPYGTSITNSGTTLTVGSTTITATPKAADAQYTYAFSSWTNGTTTVTGDTTVTAVFTRTVNKYTVTINVSPSGYGTVTKSSVAEVPYGTSITNSGSTLTVGSTTITATPKAADAQYTYAFSSWTNGTTTVTGDTTVTAVFTRTPINYTISYDLAGGTVATANPTSYNCETATFTLNNPTQTGYTFLGWTGTGLTEITPVVTIEKGSTGNRTYKAVWQVIVTVNVSGNSNNNDYVVNVFDVYGEEVGQYKQSFPVIVGDVYTFTVTTNLTKDENNNKYQILRVKLDDVSKVLTHSSARTNIESTIFDAETISGKMTIDIKYYNAYMMKINMPANSISGLSMNLIDNEEKIILSHASANAYIISEGTPVTFSVESTPVSQTEKYTFVGFTYTNQGISTSVGVNGGSGINFVRFDHNKQYENDSDVGTYSYAVADGIEISELTIDTIMTAMVSINTNIIPENASITLESIHGLNKVIDSSTEFVMLYSGRWTITSTSLSLAQLQQVFAYTIEEVNGTYVVIVA